MVESLALFSILRTITGARWTGWIAVGLLVTNPSVLYLHTTALTEPVLFAALLLTASGLARWATREKALSGGEIAVYCGLPAAAAVLSRYDGWAFVVAATGFVAVVAQLRWHQWRYSVHIARCFATPPLVAAGWWLWFNWTRFGDPLEFQRGRYSAQAQQEILAKAHQLPDMGDLGRSLHTFTAAIWMGAGWLLLGAALVGMVLWAARSRASVRGLAPWLLVLVPFGFYVASLYTGQAALRLDTHGGQSMFNLRYGVEVVPGLAVFAALGAWLVAGGASTPRVSSRRRVVVAVAVALVAVQALAWWPDWRAVPVVAEGLGQRAAGADQYAAAQWMSRHAGHGLIAIDDSVNPLLPVIDADLDRVAAPFSGSRWRRVLRDPARAEWLYVDTANPQDAIRRARGTGPPPPPRLRAPSSRRTGRGLAARGSAMTEHRNLGIATRPRLGDVLVARGAITRDELQATLARHRDTGARLGDELRSSGVVSRLDLYAALAETWGVDFVDLIANPPDDQLLRSVGSDVLLAEHWVPHHLVTRADERHAIVATAEPPTDALRASIRERLGVDDVHFLATTDWDVDEAVLLACQEEMIEAAAYGLAASRPELSADTGRARWHIVTFAIVVATLLAAAIVAPVSTLVTGLIAINVLFFVGVAFKLVACTVGAVHLAHRNRAEDPRAGGRTVAPVPRIPDGDLPVYTILVPAYHEANVVTKLIDNLGDLDYPQSKLQVLLLMEADDEETILAAKESRPPSYVRFVVVPPGGPQTKPKACNVGLALAEGEFLVIYDAEDRPESGQLREVVHRFAQSGDDVVCYQARLNYFNARENILTRMFTLEYSMWFDTMLPGLDAWRLPIPLGGTSNHFRVSSLRALGAWDPYNVTEDADLGIRASSEGLQVGITESTTWEEACSETRAWVRQRTRWIKGYMVTALVHTRQPRRLLRETGWRGITGLLGLIAGTPAMFLACPIVWGFWLFTFLGGSLGVHLPHWVQTATTVNLLVGNGAMVLLCALAALRRKQYDLMPFALLNPAYWVLHSFAAWRALVQLLVNPSHWEKTPHGIVHGPEQHAAQRAA